MRPETFQLMAQMYEESMQQSPILPRTIQAMTWAYNEICAGEDPWTDLGKSMIMPVKKKSILMGHNSNPLQAHRG